MANSAIQDLTPATSIGEMDAFVLEQNAEAKKLTGGVLKDHLLAMIDAHGGIKNIAKKSTSGLKDTYRITYADNTTFDYDITNGSGIAGIAKTGSNGVVDTYTITYTNGTTSTFTVTNGTGIESFALVSQEGLVDTYEVSFNNGDTFEFSVTNGDKGDPGDATYIWVKYSAEEPTEESHVLSDYPDNWLGIYTGPLEEAPTNWDAYDWIKVKGETGDPGVSASLIYSEVTYQVSNQGQDAPMGGTWTPGIPAVAQGQYLWTRVVQQFNAGNEVEFFTVARFGVDGTGSVVSVNGNQPDTNGNVALDANDVGALPLSGGTMSGSINMNGQKIAGLPAPTAASEPVTFGYAEEKFLRYKGALGADDDMDSVVTDGVNVYATNTRPANSPFPAAAVTMSIGSSATTTQRLQMGFRYGRTGRGKFRALHNTWTPWAEFAGYIEDTDYPGCYYRLDDANNKYWVVPPMVPSVEYPLFERHRGKLVYTQLLDFGDMLASGNKAMEFRGEEETGITELVSVVGTIDGAQKSNLPFFFNNGTVAAKMWVSSKAATVRSIQDMTGYTAKAILKYTID